MVERVFPIWSEEYNEYEKRKNKSENSNVSVDAVRTAARSNNLSVPEPVYAVSRKAENNSTMEGTQKSMTSTTGSRTKQPGTDGLSKSAGKQPMKATGKKQSKNSEVVKKKSPRNTATPQSTADVEKSRSASSSRLMRSDGSGNKEMQTRRAYSEQRVGSQSETLNRSSQPETLNRSSQPETLNRSSQSETLNRWRENEIKQFQ